MNIPLPCCPPTFLRANSLPPPPIAMIIPSPSQGSPPGSLPGGAARLGLPHYSLPPQHFGAFFAVIPCEARRAARPGADFAARWGCGITQGMPPGHFRGWCVQFSVLLRKLNVRAQLLSSPHLVLGPGRHLWLEKRVQDDLWVPIMLMCWRMGPVHLCPRGLGGFLRS